MIDGCRDFYNSIDKFATSQRAGSQRKLLQPALQAAFGYATAALYCLLPPISISRLTLEFAFGPIAS